MKANVKVLLFIVSTLSLFSCNEKLSEKELVGIWEANDGAVVKLQPNKRFSAGNIDFGKIEFPQKEFANKKMSFEGKWQLTEKSDRIKLVSESTYADYGIENTYNENGVKKSHKLGFAFEVEGSGILQNNSPWKLVIYIPSSQSLLEGTLRKEQ